MDKHVEEIKFILSISEAAGEGLEHLLKSIKEGEENPPYFLLEDVINGYFSIRESLSNFEDKLSENNLSELNLSLENELTAALLALKANDKDGFFELMEKYVIPAEIEWQKGIKNALNQYILC